VSAPPWPRSTTPSQHHEWAQHRHHATDLWATYTLFNPCFRKQGNRLRFAASDSPEDIEKLIDENTARGVYMQSAWHPAGNIADIERWPRRAPHGVPLRGQHRAEPMLLKPSIGRGHRRPFAEKFFGVMARPWAGRCPTAAVSTGQARSDRFPMLTKPRMPITASSTPSTTQVAFVARCRTVCQRNTGAVSGVEFVPAAKARRPCRYVWNACQEHNARSSPI